jgi:surfeit locus 1 family protein
VHRGRLWAARSLGAPSARDVSDIAQAPPAAETARERRRAVVVVIAALAGIALATRLGFWQLDRAHQKIALQTSLDARAREPVLDAAALARTVDAAEAQHQRRVVVRGHWLADRTVYLDNRQMDGRVGFFVVTPLVLEPGPGAILVQRGWAPRSFTERDALPRVSTPTGTVTVEGTLAGSPSRLFDFAGAASGPIRQNLDIGPFARETGVALLPLSVVQRDTPDAAADGLLRHWPAPATDVQKHYGYAVQWFAIAAAIAFLYVWHRFIRPGKP